MALTHSLTIIISCTPQSLVTSVEWLPSWCCLLLPLEFINSSSVMVMSHLHHILSILHIPIVIRDSPTQPGRLLQALSLSSQDRMVQLLVLAVLSPDSKGTNVQDLGSGLAWGPEGF